MKSILITGGEGMIGMELRDLLHALGEEDIKILDIKNGDDITDYKTCLKYCDGVDEVYHLFGIKGNPRMTKERPADFMIPMLLGDTNMIKAAKECGVKKFLYTSSIAVLNPQTDKYPAWAKQTAENLIYAMRTQYSNETQYCIIRPANVYGKYDNFLNENAMVITSLIRKALHDDELHVWGDGSETRQFINAEDVARAMVHAMDLMPEDPINLCGKEEVSIKEIVDIIMKHVHKDIPVFYEEQLAVGDKKRTMKSNAEMILFNPIVDLETGIKECIEYARKQI